MMVRKVIIVLCVSFLLFTNCSESVTEPALEQGRRDYIWTIDTLDIYYPVYKIWGSSPTDVWIINQSDNFNSIWHYDGNSWSTDGIFRSILPYAIWGFSKNNVSIGGSGGKIWKFDGTNWDEVAVLTKNGQATIILNNMWGKSSKDFYAFGAYPDDDGYYNKSVIAHYQNKKWSMLNTDAIKGIVLHLFENEADNNIYFSLSKIGGTEQIDSTIIYEYRQNKFQKIYSSLEIQGFQADISLIDKEVYFILCSKITKRRNNQFIFF